MNFLNGHVVLIFTSVLLVICFLIYHINWYSTPHTLKKIAI